MITPRDEPFLRRALRLAMNGRGHVEPNPMVGCVLVKNDTITGEGWHEKFGSPHAEPNALNDCKARGNDPVGATAYVTLEPCCHENKKTPPCVPRLIEAKIARVVIGCLDPNPDVNGRGVAMLQTAGIEVEVLPSGTGYQPVSFLPGNQHPAGSPSHVLDSSQFQQLIAPFVFRQRPSRPYITLKWAESANKEISGPDGSPRRISNTTSTAFVHRLRARSDGIMVGVNTILSDNPRLTARGVIDSKLKAAYILDSTLRTPSTARIFDGLQVTVYMSSWPVRNDGRIERLQALAGRRCLGVAGDARGRILLSSVFALGFPPLSTATHLLVEPGPTLARSFFQAGLCDRLLVVASSERTEGPTAPLAAAIPSDFITTGVLSLAGDTLTEYLNTNSPAFFAAVPSADFVLAQESASSVA